MASPMNSITALAMSRRLSIRVTIVFALFTGPVSYILCFLLAWLINELHPKLKTIFTLIFYAPSLANVYTAWTLIFSGGNDLCTPYIAKTMADRIPNAQWTLFRESRGDLLVSGHCHRHGNHSPFHKKVYSCPSFFARKIQSLITPLQNAGCRGILLQNPPRKYI